GGTVGDIEGLPFLEAVRQFRKDLGRGNVLDIHVTLVPFLDTTGEFKTKPTQHSGKELRSIGIHPEVIICRSREALTEELKDKISLFCDTAREAVIGLMDTESIYEIPLILEEQGLADIVINYLGLKVKMTDLIEWKKMVADMKNPSKRVNIAIVGKYTQLSDAYLSIVESLKHGGVVSQAGIDIKWINSEDLEKTGDLEPFFRDVHGLIVPGGFGVRGVEGKIFAIQYARLNKIPFLGLCLGMQCAVIEFARNACGMKKANSTEFDEKTPYPVIDLLPEQKGIVEKGGTMRLGAYPCIIKKDTLLYEAYKETLVDERHRHRYELNNKFRERLSSNGMVFSGIYPDVDLVEVVEIKDHPWFMATQFHPEFKSRPTRCHPIFRDFVKAATLRLKEQESLF
ncbi:MAG: CTP synthase, partial [Candidatus Saganbacteria bacterium]|nr:CTP synthase [Candidatus Saganbacteria bacterium]